MKRWPRRVSGGIGAVDARVVGRFLVGDGDPDAVAPPADLDDHQPARGTRGRVHQGVGGPSAMRLLSLATFGIRMCSQSIRK